MHSAILAAAYFDWLYEALGSVMAFFYAIVPSYGFAIAMLTVTVRMLLIPLTAKQVKSQRAMQQLQPELKKLQAKHKGDRQKLNEEMMKLYKENKANPLAGCLPLILQMPLFIILYRLIIDLSKVPPRHIPLGSDLHQALVASQGKLESLGMNLAEKPQTVIGLLLVAAVVGTGYFQQKQMTARLPKDSINPQMQMVTKIFPVVFGFISLSVPAGVVLYFVVSNLWQIGQQAVAFRNREPVVAADDDAAPKAVGKASGGGGGSSPAKGGGPKPKGGGPATKSGGSNPKGGGGAKGGGAKGGPAKATGPRSGGGGGGANRPPSGRVTPKGGGKPSGRVTPKGGPAAARAAAGQKGGKADSRSPAGGSSASSKSGSARSSDGPSSDGESLWSRLSPMNRAAKPTRPPPAARPKGLPPKGSSGGSSRKET